MSVRIYGFAPIAALALTACGPAEEPAANVATNDLSTLDAVVEQNAAVAEAPVINTVPEPVADSPEQPTAKEPAPKKAVPTKAEPATAPEAKATEPAIPDPTCAPEHRAAGHC